MSAPLEQSEGKQLSVPIEAGAIGAGTVRAWILAARPKTLSAAAAPVLVGTAVAAACGGWRLLPAFAALGGALAIQVGTNFANDVFDFEKGADTAERVGPLRATQSGLISPAAMRIGMFFAFAVATAFGAYLATLGGWPIVWVGLASIASGIAYTGGPWPLGYHGLGDLFVFVFFGLVAVCGTVFVQLGEVPVAAILAGVPVGALATAILVVNNVRDVETDAKAGKRTLAVRLGRKAGVAEFAVLQLLVLVSVIVLAVLRHSAWPLLPLLLFPEALRLTRMLHRERGPALNAALAATARQLAACSALLALGIAL